MTAPLPTTHALDYCRNIADSSPFLPVRVAVCTCGFATLGYPSDDNAISALTRHHLKRMNGVKP